MKPNLTPIAPTLEEDYPALRKLLYPWKSMLDAISEAVCLLDREGRVRRCNQAMSRLTGRTGREMKGCDFYEQLQETLGPLQFVYPPVGTGEGDIRTLVYTADKVFRMSENPLLDEQGESVGTVVVLNDITVYIRLREKDDERLGRQEKLIQQRTAELVALNQQLKEKIVEQQEVEERLQVSEERLRSIVVGASDCIFTKSRDLVYVEVNSALTRLLGAPESDIIGRRDRDFFSRGQAALIDLEDRAVLNGREIRKDVARKIGDTIYFFHTIKFPLRDAEGNITGIGGISRDITEERKSDQQMLVRQAALKAQQEALLKWAKSDKLNSGEYLATMEEITEDAAYTLGVERVGVWFYNEHRTSLKCVCQYELSCNRHHVGESLDCSRYPYYFEALGAERVIAAQYACTDLRTREFADSYYLPKGVVSVIDAPIHLDGTIVGVVRHEHVGPSKRWTLEDQNFAGSVADFVSLAVQRRNRRQAEEKLEGQLWFMQQLIDSIPNPVYYKDQREVYLGCNKAFEEFLGKDRSEIIGRSVSEFLPLKWSVRYRVLDRNLLVKPGYQVYEGMTLHADGQERHVIFYKSVFSDRDGNPAGIVGVIADIDERKRAEDALRESEARYRTLIESATDFIGMIDGQGRMQLINQVGAEMLGCRPADVIGKTLWEVMPEAADAVMEVVHRVLQTGAGISFIREAKHNGSSRWYSENVQPVRDSEGNSSCVQVITRDITAQKLLELEYARLDRLHLVGEMAASIGHEVRNPLATVRGFLQLTEEKCERAGCQEGHRGYFALMIEELDRANAIISEFLTLAKDRAINLKPTNLNDVIDSLLPLIQSDAMISDQVVRFEPKEVPSLLLDEREMRQLVINLARNGMEAMSPGGTLTISTGVVEGSVVLTVRDEGKGIDGEIVERLGTPFLTTKEHGIGLGLAVCYHIADRHGASIGVETGPDGTVISVRFSENRGRTGE